MLTVAHSIHSRFVSLALTTAACTAMTMTSGCVTNIDYSPPPRYFHVRDYLQTIEGPDARDIHSPYALGSSFRLVVITNMYDPCALTYHSLDEHVLRITGVDSCRNINVEAAGSGKTSFEVRLERNDKLLKSFAVRVAKPNRVTWHFRQSVILKQNLVLPSPVHLLASPTDEESDPRHFLPISVLAQLYQDETSLAGTGNLSVEYPDGVATITADSWNAFSSLRILNQSSGAWDLTVNQAGKRIDTIHVLGTSEEDLSGIRLIDSCSESESDICSVWATGKNDHGDTIYGTGFTWKLQPEDSTSGTAGNLLLCTPSKDITRSFSVARGALQMKSSTAGDCGDVIVGADQPMFDPSVWGPSCSYAPASRSSSGRPWSGMLAVLGALLFSLRRRRR